MSLIKIVNIETGEEIEREMNADELAQLELDKQTAANQLKAKQDAESAKNALLEKLGITEEEAKLLLS